MVLSSLIVCPTLRFTWPIIYYILFISIEMEYEVQAAVSALGILEGNEYKKEADCLGFYGFIYSISTILIQPLQMFQRL